MTRPLLPAPKPIREDDAFLANALESASIPALMMSIVHISGDTGLLAGRIRPQKAVLGEVQGGVAPDDQAEVRRLALEVLGRYRDGGCSLPPQPDTDTIRRMMSFAVGEEVPERYVPMMLEEMALDGVDSRDVRLSPGEAGLERDDFHVLVIGAGMSGLLAAIRLQESGIGFTIVEKNDAVGGTWYENTYPGCRVDVANHFYCYSFEPNSEWSEHFSQQRELRDYFQSCAARHGIRDRVRYRTEVESARYDVEGSAWLVRLRGADGGTEDLRCSAIISAVGQLNRPKLPDIPGRETFRGPSFHSARWEHEHDLQGRCVAVVGTGASALQLVPEVAKTAGRLLVFQRSPAWMFPNPRYHAPVSEGARWLLAHVPYYARWYRFLLFWPGSDGLMPSLIVDPDWPHPERSVNALNDQARVLFTDYMRSQLGDDLELLQKVVPTYPPFGKRILQDNGSWLATLKLDHVDLVTDEIERIESDSIVCTNGDTHPVDAIVYATGFHANRFLWPMEIEGRDGQKLAHVWGEEPRAYLGITVPRFPNLFCLYGPGTNLAHAGSIIFHSECQVRYVMGCLELLLEGGHASMECRQDVHDAYNERFDAAAARTVWSHPGMTSWYKNRKGRVTTTSPWLLADYWSWTRRPDPADYEFRD